MFPATDDRLLELAHHLEGVAKVAGSLGLAQTVAHGPGQRQVVFVELGMRKNRSVCGNASKLNKNQRDIFQRRGRGGVVINMSIFGNCLKSNTNLIGLMLTQIE
jgi:hypothetical protein